MIDPAEFIFTLFASAAKCLAARAHVIGVEATLAEVDAAAATPAVDVESLCLSFGAMVIGHMLAEIPAADIWEVDVPAVTARWRRTVQEER